MFNFNARFKRYQFMKKLLLMILFGYSTVTFADPLPHTEAGTVYMVPTDFIPADKTAEIECYLPKKIHKEKPRKYSYIYVYPYKEKFGGIYRTKFSNNTPLEELGGKIYKKDSDDKKGFKFRIDKVSLENEAIVIDTRVAGRNALELHCKVTKYMNK